MPELVVAEFNEYHVGDVIRVTGTLEDADGTDTDPGTLTIKHKDPSGNIASLVYGEDVAVKKSATGIYYLDIVIDEVGLWYYNFTSTVTAAAASEGGFRACATEFD